MSVSYRTFIHAAHLRRLVGNQDALSSCDGVLQVLGVVVSLHSDQMARRCDLAWRQHELRYKQLKLEDNLENCEEPTVIKLAAELVVRAALHHLSHMLGFLVHWHGPDDGSLRRRGQHFDLNGARLCNLAVQLLQVC